MSETYNFTLTDPLTIEGSIRGVVVRNIAISGLLVYEFSEGTWELTIKQRYNISRPNMWREDGRKLTDKQEADFREAVADKANEWAADNQAYIQSEQFRLLLEENRSLKYRLDELEDRVDRLNDNDDYYY